VIKAGDTTLKEVGRDGGGPQQHRERKHATDDGQDRDPETAHNDSDAIEEVQRRTEQMHNVERRHQPGEHRDQPRQRGVRNESRSQADH